RLGGCYSNWPTGGRSVMPAKLHRRYLPGAYMEAMAELNWFNWLFHRAKTATLPLGLCKLFFVVLLLPGLTVAILCHQGTSHTLPHTLQEFTTHLKHHGVQLKELPTGLYLYLSENSDMTLERCTRLPFFPARVRDWRGIVVVSQREIKNITVVPVGGSRNP